MKRRFVSVGECMIEMSPYEGGLFRRAFAGDCLNTAWYARAALDQTWQVDFVSSLGDDIYSTQMLNFFKENHIGTSYINRLEGKTCGLCMIHHADGDRHFTYWRESSAARHLAEDATALSNALRGASLIHFSGITLAIIGEPGRSNLRAALKNARQSGARIAFDPNIRLRLWSSKTELKTAHQQFYDLVDIALPSFDDEATIFGDLSPRDTARRYLEYGIEQVVVKNAEQNALVADKDQMIDISTEPQSPLDPTGAGDAFNGAFLAGYENGLGMKQSALLAHRVAGEVIMQRGALIDPQNFKQLLQK